MTQKRNKGRAAGMTTITFPIEETKKAALISRASKTPAGLTVADLCRLALNHQDKRGWKDIPEARME